VSWVADEGKYAFGGVFAEGLVGPRFSAHHLPTGSMVEFEEIPHELAGNRGFVRQLAKATGAAGSLSSPHTIGVHGVVTIGGHLCLASDLFRGRSLAALMGAESPLPAAKALFVADCVLGGLEELHRAGLVHGDVCAEAITVATGGEVRLGEIGLARALASEPSLIAWPEVVPPEGGAPSPAADLYAVGALLREMVSGWRPEEIGEWMPPVQLGWLVARAVAVAPEKRFPDASAFRQELEWTAVALLGPNWRRQSDLGRRASRPLAPGTARRRLGHSVSVALSDGRRVTLRGTVAPDAARWARVHPVQPPEEASRA